MVSFAIIFPNGLDFQSDYDTMIEKKETKGGLVMKGTLLVVGSLNMDASIRVARMPRVGETILGEQITFSPGGKGANQAYAAAKLGAAVHMAGAVGEDGFGQTLCDHLQSVGVDCSLVRRVPDVSTGSAFIVVDQDGNNSIIVAQGANAACTADQISEEAVKSCDAVLLQMEIPLDTIESVIRRAHDLGKLVVLNPAPAPNHLPPSLYQGIDWLTPNETELQTLTGETCCSMEDLVNAAQKLLDFGVQQVLVTVGDQGALWVNRERALLFPSRKVQAVDTTAAGDTFHGAWLCALLEGRSIEEAIVFGNLAASIAVTRPGAQSSIPDRAEVEALASDAIQPILVS